MVIFYAPYIAETPFLPEEESLHCARVLRMRAGDEVFVIDGKGGLYRARIVRAHDKRTEVEIISVEQQFGKRDFSLHLAVAPTKNIERFEWFVEKATEIGFDTITPLLSRYSERKVLKRDRIEKIIVSASKQSYKAFVPQLNDMISVDEFLAQGGLGDQRFIAHCHEGDKQHLLRACKAGGDVVVMVGPEGDFSEEEVAKAIESGFVPVSLGESRLRTETAGIVACHLVNLANL